MPKVFHPSQVELLPGDTLLYHGQSVFDWIVKIKTWSPFVHSEKYAGNGFSFGARAGGVSKYNLRTEGLAKVLRPKVAYNFDNGRRWFYERACGQGYDYIGLLNFAYAVRVASPDRMWCSEFITRFDRQCGCELFSPWTDADKVPPSYLDLSPSFNVVWQE